MENIIRTLKEQGEPLILISHNMRQVMDLRARIVEELSRIAACHRAGDFKYMLTAFLIRQGNLFRPWMRAPEPADGMPISWLGVRSMAQSRRWEPQSPGLSL